MKIKNFLPTYIPGGEQGCRQSVFNLRRESLKIKNTTLNFIPAGEQVCRQSVFNLRRESLKIKNTLPQLYSWG